MSRSGDKVFDQNSFFEKAAANVLGECAHVVVFAGRDRPFGQRYVCSGVFDYQSSCAQNCRPRRNASLHLVLFRCCGNTSLDGNLDEYRNCIAIVIGLIVLLLARSHWSIPKDGLEIFKSHPAFAHIPPGDFRAVFKEASRYRVSSDTQITIEGEHCDHFFYLVDGSASAQKLGQTFDLPGGIFIGEVAYLLDQPSSATITVKSGTEVLSWSIPDVRARARRKPRFGLALEAVITRDLARKVAAAVAPTSRPI